MGIGVLFGMGGVAWAAPGGAASAPTKTPKGEPNEEGLWDFPLESETPDSSSNAGSKAAPKAADRSIDTRSYEFFGDFELELRAFAQSPAEPQQPRWLNTALAFRPGYSWSPESWLALRAIGLVRLDKHDTGRSRFDAREAYVQLSSGTWTATLGINRVFWGVAESRHLVDVINQVDFREDLSGDARFGQLMAMVSRDTQRFGFIEVFALSWFRPQTFPANTTRPGLPLPLSDNPRYESSQREWHVDLAARWSMNTADLAWALSYTVGRAANQNSFPPSREPSW